ncbi:hypothetical protein IEO21_09431 [Rhodonia placenta]|nr:hypothetical protein IEO21_09431 [Postia placenta]
MYVPHAIVPYGHR